MSFMAGFASGFGKQIEAGQERKAVKERDALAIAMERWNKRTTEYDTAKKTDTQLQEQAKGIAVRNGLPEGSWVSIYQDALLKDMSLENAEKWAKGQTWSVLEETPSMPDQPAKPATAQDAQMVDSGLAPGQAETPGQTDPGILGSVAGAVGGVLGTIGNPQAQQEALMTGANDRAVGALGLTPEQAAQYETGYKPTPITPTTTYTPKPEEGDLFDIKRFNDEYQVLFMDGKPNANGMWDETRGVWVDNKNQPIEGNVSRSMPQTAYNDYIEAIKLVNPTVAKLNERKDNVMGLAEEASNISAIVAKNPKVLTWAGETSAFLNDGITNLVSLADQYGGVTSPEFQQAEASLITTAQQGLTDMGIGQNANDFAAYISGRTKLVYSAARANAGDTGNMSNQEVENASKMFGTADQEDFNRQLQQYVGLQINSFDRTAKTLMDRDLGVATARQQGISVDQLFGPIMETADEETRRFLETNFAGAGGAGGPTSEAAGKASEASAPRLLQGSNLQQVIAQFPQLKDYPGEIFLTPTGELVDGEGNPIGDDTEE